jgi:hypothetical protein
MVSVGKIVLTIENGLAAQRSVLLASLEVVEKGLEAATAQLANVNEGPAAGRARKLQTLQPYIRFATKERDDALAALKAFQEQQFEFEGLRNEDVSMIVTHGCSLLWLGGGQPTMTMSKIWPLQRLCQHFHLAGLSGPAKLFLAPAKDGGAPPEPDDEAGNAVAPPSWVPPSGLALHWRSGRRQRFDHHLFITPASGHAFTLCDTPLD